VSRVGGEPAPQRVVWYVEPVGENRPFKTVTYGVPPAGWATKKMPLPLEQGKFYQIGLYYFSCGGTVPDGTCEICDVDHFDRDTQSCRSTK
jgi:hypothetical protein